MALLTIHLQSFKQLHNQMCHRVEVLHYRLSLIREALHLDKSHGKVTHLVPNVKHNIYLAIV